MHILLGILGAVVTILVLAKKLGAAGYTPADFNPFLWHRRHQWRQQHDAHPIFKLQQPMDVAGLLVTAMATVDGLTSVEQKGAVLNCFQKQLQLTEQQALELMTSSSHLLHDNDHIQTGMEQILQPSLSQFTQAQAQSTLTMMADVAAVEGVISVTQRRLMAQAKQYFFGREHGNTNSTSVDSQ